MRIIYEVPGRIPGTRAAPVHRGGLSRETVLVVRLGERGGFKEPESVGNPAPGSPSAVDSGTVRARDAAVRAHEAAHLSTLGPYAASAADARVAAEAYRLMSKAAAELMVDERV